MTEVPPVDQQALFVFGTIAMTVVGPLMTEYLKRYEVFKVRPMATLTGICLIVLGIGWLIIDRSGAHFIPYMAYALTAATTGAVAYESGKNLTPKDQWNEATGKIRLKIPAKPPQV